MKYIVGLGNPGVEYEKTRHNTGRIIISFVEDKIETKVKFIMPDSFMNNSGKVVVPLIKSKKDLADLIVIYDDIDLPLGKIKISFNRSSGGHNGVGSIIKHLKTEEFVRIRVGICSTTPTGKLKKPKGEEAILKFLLGEFKKEEIAELKKLSKKIAEAIDTFYTDGLGKAMSLYN